ncbi:hypothetical protein [Flavobacterium sp. MDT1-60]|uniref:hypothetical protein n=1 Tax=Flavobacterium sp. MDT1-60 TaxID=1979344 RepID=UPI001CE0E20C|nr:hypothetical protein [Flavobacterium sp. MDT1-60]
MIKKNNFFSCDIFGKTTSLGKIPDYDQIEIINPNSYIFRKANLLYFTDKTSADLDTFSEIEILQKSFDKFCYKDQILSIFTTKEITNYKIVTP